MILEMEQQFCAYEEYTYILAYCQKLKSSLGHLANPISELDD